MSVSDLCNCLILTVEASFWIFANPNVFFVISASHLMLCLNCVSQTGRHVVCTLFCFFYSFWVMTLMGFVFSKLNWIKYCCIHSYVRRLCYFTPGSWVKYCFGSFLCFSAWVNIDNIRLWLVNGWTDLYETWYELM